MENFKQVLTILLLSTLRAEQSASTGDRQEWGGFKNRVNLKIIHSEYAKVVKSLKIRFLKTYEVKIFES